MLFSTFVSFFNKHSLTFEGDIVDEHLFLESPLNVVTILLVYLLFVYKWGPRIMKNREAFDLKRIMVVYNVAQVILNIVLFIMVARLTPSFNAYCSPVSISKSESDVAIRKVHYLYTLLKFFDLFDTVFFVLRKRHTQISFLHIHHHVGIALSTWITLKQVPGGVIFFIFIANTFVHVVMYFYYLLSSLDLGKALWWKKYLTQLQLVQHFLIFSVFSIHLVNPECSYSKGWLLYYLSNVVLTIYLFSNFYIKTYTSKINKCKDM